MRNTDITHRAIATIRRLTIKQFALFFHSFLTVNQDLSFEFINSNTTEFLETIKNLVLQIHYDKQARKLWPFKTFKAFYAQKLIDNYDSSYYPFVHRLAIAATVKNMTKEKLDDFAIFYLTQQQGETTNENYLSSNQLPW